MDCGPIRKRVLQVKVCYTEDELNKFLASFDYTEGSLNTVQDISYLNCPTGEMTETSGKIVTNLVTIVRYWTTVEEWL